MTAGPQPPLNGKHTEYHGHGQTSVAGEYRNGEKHYAWKFYLPDGTLRAEGKYASGEKSGKWKYYRKNGMILLSGHFNNGVREREWDFYRSTGGLYKQLIYHKDKVLSKFLYHNDGTRTEIVDGIVIATWNWDDEGTLHRFIHATGEVMVSRSVQVE